MKVFNKLIRDKVLTFIERNGHTYKSKVLTDKEFKDELLNKLVEEATEVKEATDELERIVELADVMEVIDAIREVYKIDSGDLTRAQTRKRKERGGCKDKLYLESIDEQ
jgi:predicted house-cleaning noncanonical NTP pyrophosphatase (MazG superfamily)